MTAAMTSMHADCVMCRASHDNIDPARAIAIVLVMIVGGGSDPRDVVRGLCFAHRRTVDGAIKSTEREGA